MLKALLALQAHVQEHGEPPVTVDGICYNLLELVQTPQFITRLFDAFETLGYDRHEPIPDYSYHRSQSDLWVGEQKELRLDLIQKLINYFQEQENA